MKTLTLVRQGNYDCHTLGDLTSSGERALTDLSRVIAARSFGNFYVCSSPVRAAYQSAEVLSGYLGVTTPTEVLPCLEHRDYGLKRPKAAEIEREVQKRKNLADNLILVTHLPIVRNFPNFFTKGKAWDIEYFPVIRECDAIGLYCEDRTAELLTPEIVLWNAAFNEREASRLPF